MKKIISILLLTSAILSYASCKKDTLRTEDIDTPRSQSVPAELIGRWAITSISGTTVYNIPSGATLNSNEVFLGYTINPDGTTQEHGYASTYQYGVSSWARWACVGSIQLEGEAISFHRARGSYTSSRNNSPKDFGEAEVYPNKSSSYAAYEIGTDSRGYTALFLYDEDGTVHTYVKQ